MGVLSTPTTVETLTITDGLEGNSDVEAILEDFKKLHFPKPTDSSVQYSSDDLLNYNDGKDANPFNKIAVYYGRHKDVFLFVATVFNPNQQEKFVKIIQEKCNGDMEAIKEFVKRMKTYMKRISKGTQDATDFLPEELKGCPAFFNGYHVDQSGHKRNIHENLNINLKAGVAMNLSELYNRDIPGKEEGQSELRRLKIYANGQRAMTLYKEDNAVRRYTPTKTAQMDLEVKWVAQDPNSKEDLKCKVILKFKDGKINVDFGEIEGNDGSVRKAKMADMLELSKQNDMIRIRNKSLHELLEKKAARKGQTLLTPEEQVKQMKAITSEMTSVPMTTWCREKVIPIDLPKAEETLKDKLEAVSKLNFAPEGIFTDPNDEYNFNDGKKANPFDKLAKVQGRRKDVFLFNKMLCSPEQVGMMMNIIAEKCGNDVQAKRDFLKRKDIYMKRISQGKKDAMEILGEDFDENFVEAFTHGYHVAHEGHRRNIHENLNVNLVGVNEKGLETSSYFKRVTPVLENEKSELQRIKLYGNGRRLVNILKMNAERNYKFSNMASMKMEIEWDAKNKQEEMIRCFIVLVIKSGEISVETATLNGTSVEAIEVLEFAKQNKETLVGNKNLHMLLKQVLFPRKIINSQEELTVHKLLKDAEVPQDFLFKALLEDVSKLDFSSEECQDSSDPLNYNDSLKANQFEKLRKYWGRQKDVLFFLSAFEDAKQREEVLNLVKSKCGERVKTLEKFEKRMDIFLKRMQKSKEDAQQFLRMMFENYEDLQMSAAFGGYHIPQHGHERNIHANLTLNMEKNEPEFTMPIMDFFTRITPRMREEKSSLKRIKLLLCHQGRVATILWNDKGQRNYTFGEQAKMDLKVKWSVEKKECELLLKIEKGVVSILSTKIDGDPVHPSDILDFVKENQEVLLRNKSLYDVLREQILNKEDSPPVYQEADFGDGAFVILESPSDADGSDIMGDW